MVGPQKSTGTTCASFPPPRIPLRVGSAQGPPPQAHQPHVPHHQSANHPTINPPPWTPHHHHHHPSHQLHPTPPATPPATPPPTTSPADTQDLCRPTIIADAPSPMSPFASPVTRPTSPTMSPVMTFCHLSQSARSELRRLGRLIDRLDPDGECSSRPTTMTAQPCPEGEGGDQTAPGVGGGTLVPRYHDSPQESAKIRGTSESSFGAHYDHQ
ncbi:uncharacterized protein LOC134536447 [Bacillus rossius redtenbacheri]|uniref:uncharacterized protein LOC134536447 n=1 Tax=Bacillus rossius redtenbacheri TaxID=93214 RepID=UPI002FDDB83C